MKKKFFKIISKLNFLKKVNLIILFFITNQYLNPSNKIDCSTKILKYIQSQTFFPNELNKIILNYLNPTKKFEYFNTIKLPARETNLKQEKQNSKHINARYIKFQVDNTIKAYAAVTLKCLTAEYSILNIDGEILIKTQYEHDLSPINYEDFKYNPYDKNENDLKIIIDQGKLKIKKNFFDSEDYLIHSTNIETFCLIENDILSCATKDSIFLWDIKDLNKIELIQSLNIPIQTYDNSNNTAFILNLTSSIDGLFLAASFSNANIVIWKKKDFDIF